jgi:hypothetical protein
VCASNQQAIARVVIIRTPRSKYIRYISETRSFDELYDLQCDPGEERNDKK